MHEQICQIRIKLPSRAWEKGKIQSFPNMIGLYENLMKKNTILVDFDVPDDWEYKRGIEDVTGEKWELWKCITHRLQSSKLKILLRYIITFLFAFKVFLHRKKYKRIIAWQQFYGLAVAFFCKLFKVKDYPEIYIMTFIYKNNKSRVFSKFVKYAVDPRYIKKLIVMSDSEKQFYSKELKLDGSLFYCTRVGVKDETNSIKQNITEKYYLAVGRSNRDYKFLRDAWKNEYGKLIIVNDSYKEPEKDGIICLKKCYGRDYLQMVANCYAEVIPLNDKNISSGALSFLQAMMFSKPVIVTSNMTVKDYIKSGYNGVIIENTSEELEGAINQLENPILYQKIASNARKEYEEKYSELILGKDIGKKTNYIMYSSMIAAIINLILNYICINIFGYMAAAYTTLVAYIVLAGAQVIFARKIHLKRTGEKSVYNDKAVLFMAILTILAALLGLVLYRYTWLRYIIICIGMIAGIKIALTALKRIKNN